MECRFLYALEWLSPAKHLRPHGSVEGDSLGGLEDPVSSGAPLLSPQQPSNESSSCAVAALPLVSARRSAIPSARGS